ncbi:AAA domain-containing protein [Mycena maculata]|uniref:AAA domain-containing protein n=1 Tax=Mycena maculata TaxID=230809 RepID=A0AAD7HNE9_9AGAR|nr:AAA domain-containing protein [Mycena maculata]
MSPKATKPQAVPAGGYAKSLRFIVRCRSKKKTQNPEEIQIICHLVRRYAHKSFCVITPYDAQREAIKRQLEAEDLPSDAVFNADSFQGNEADYVLISVVRTSRPGFLASPNRMNVMLTRARKGMVIVTSSSFIHSDGGAKTLLGKLWQYWETRGNNGWLDWKRVADGTAALPGSSGKPPFSGEISELRPSMRPLPRIAPPPKHETDDTWRKPEMKRDVEFPALPGFSHKKSPAPWKLGGSYSGAAYSQAFHSKPTGVMSARENMSAGSWRTPNPCTAPQVSSASDFPPLRRH